MKHSRTVNDWINAVRQSESVPELEYNTKMANKAISEEKELYSIYDITPLTMSPKKMASMFRLLKESITKAKELK